MAMSMAVMSDRGTRKTSHVSIHLLLIMPIKVVQTRCPRVCDTFSRQCIQRGDEGRTNVLPRPSTDVILRAAMAAGNSKTVTDTMASASASAPASLSDADAGTLALALAIALASVVASDSR